MNELPDLDACGRLLRAVSLAWCRDAQRDPAELADLAGWLEVAPETLQKALDARRIEHERTTDARR